MSHLLAALLLSCKTTDTTEPGDPETEPGDTATEPGDTGEDTPVEGVDFSEVSVTVLDTMGSILVVSWTQHVTATAWLEFSFDEGEWWSSPPMEREAGAAEELVLGAPFETEVQVRLVWEGGESELLTQETGPLPDGAPIAGSVEGDPAKWDTDAPWVLACLAGRTADVNGTWSFILDRKGRSVWAKEADSSRICMQTQLSLDGTGILIDQSSFWAIFDGGEGARVDRVDIEGNVIETYDTPGMHHPFAELPDGSIAYGAVSGYFAEEELKVTGQDGTTTTLWSCADFLATEGQQPGDYCGSNTLSWSEETSTFLYSFFSLETVMEIDGSGELVRYFGHRGDNAWSFSDPDTAFWWQHGAHYTDAGTLLLSSKDEDGGSETVAVEYELDEGSQTLVEIFRFGEGEGIYGDTMGEADYTPGGNILHNYGSAIRLREITPDGEVAWDVEWDGDMLGRTTPLSDLYGIR